MQINKNEITYEIICWAMVTHNHINHCVEWCSLLLFLEYKSYSKISVLTGVPKTTVFRYVNTAIKNLNEKYLCK